MEKRKRIVRGSNDEGRSQINNLTCKTFSSSCVLEEEALP